MAAYIEREAIKYELWSVGPLNEPMMVVRKETIDRIPAADVALARQGKWEWREEWETHPETHSCDLISCGWYCTGCGIELGEYLTKATGRFVCLDDDYVKPKLNCCPNCGAKMKIAR